MKIGKGTIKNLNLKILSGTLALTIVTTGLTGCSLDIDNNNWFDVTQINEQGEKIYTDKIKHSSMDDYKIVVFEKNDEYSIFIVRNAGLEYSVKYYNIFDFTLIYDGKDSNLNIVSEESLVEYLTIKDRVQVEYTSEEIQDILKEYKENYKKETNKQKVKEK